MLNLKIRYLLLANYINLFAFAFFSPLYALYVIGIGGTPKAVGVTLAVGTYTTAFMVFLFGRYENRLPKEKMVVIGYFWLAAGAASYILVDHIWQLFIVQIFNAIGTGILLPAWKTSYAKHEDRGKEAQEWSFLDGGNALFAATGALLSGFLLSSVGGFKSLFALIAALQLVGALFSLQLLKKRR